MFVVLKKLLYYKPEKKNYKRLLLNEVFETRAFP